MKTKKIINGIDIPSAKTTLFEYRRRGSKKSTYVDIKVEQDGIIYYLLHPNGDREEIGELMELLKRLRRWNAKWLTRKSSGSSPKERRIFIDRNEAIRVLEKGYTVVALEMGTKISPLEDYSGYLSSNGEVYPANELPACMYCVDWSQDPIKSRAEFEKNEAKKIAHLQEEARKEAEQKAEKLEAENRLNEEARKEAEQKAEKLEAENRLNEEARKEAEQKAEKLEAETATFKAENHRLKEAAERIAPTTVKEPKGFGWWCEKVCLIAGGAVVGALFGLGMSNPKN